MTATALVLSDGLLHTTQAKTAHGLLYGASRYEIKGIVDDLHAGKNAGLVFSNRQSEVPIYASVEEAIAKLGFTPDFCVVGVAPVGGKLNSTLKENLLKAAAQGMSLVSGLHHYLCDDADILAVAQQHQVKLIDIRKPKAAKDLAIWTGNIHKVSTPRIAVLGTDCGLGKRTTSVGLLSLCLKHGIKAEMIYTGQTGWLQNMKHGFILDSTLNDFVAGEMEQAILDSVDESHPELIFIEGQSSLRNPAGPCGAELLLSAGAKYVILQHSPARSHFICDSTHTYAIPDVAEEIALINHYGAEVVALCLNSQGMDPHQLDATKHDLHAKTKIPVIYPREEGFEALLTLLKQIVQKELHHENY